MNDTHSFASGASTSAFTVAQVVSFTIYFVLLASMSCHTILHWKELTSQQNQSTNINITRMPWRNNLCTQLHYVNWSGSASAQSVTWPDSNTTKFVCWHIQYHAKYSKRRSYPCIFRCNTISFTWPCVECMWRMSTLFYMNL